MNKKHPPPKKKIKINNNNNNTPPQKKKKPKKHSYLWQGILIIKIYIFFINDYFLVQPQPEIICNSGIKVLWPAYFTHIVKEFFSDILHGDYKRGLNFRSVVRLLWTSSPYRVFCIFYKPLFCVMNSEVLLIGSKYIGDLLLFRGAVQYRISVRNSS